MRLYSCDFVGSALKSIADTPCHVLSWRNRNNEVYYRAVEGTDVFLLQHFQTQNDTYAQLLHGLQTLLQGQDIDGLLKAAVGAWVEASVLLVIK